MSDQEFRYVVVNPCKSLQFRHWVKVYLAKLCIYNE